MKDHGKSVISTEAVLKKIANLMKFHYPGRTNELLGAEHVESRSKSVVQSATELSQNLVLSQSVNLDYGGTR